MSVLRGPLFSPDELLLLVFNEQDFDELLLCFQHAPSDEVRRGIIDHALDLYERREIQFSANELELALVLMAEVRPFASSEQLRRLDKLLPASL